MPSEEDWKVKQSAIIIINLTSGMRCVAYILQVNIFCQYGENDSVALVISAGLTLGFAGKTLNGSRPSAPDKQAGVREGWPPQASGGRQ